MLAADSISAVFDKARAGEREQDYMQRIKKYSKEEKNVSENVFLYQQQL